jgi:four helix bundle protein
LKFGVGGEICTVFCWAKGWRGGRDFVACVVATFKAFTEITAWQKARRLSVDIFKLTAQAPFSRDFALKDQINRSSGSIMDNIAEGFGRGSKNEFVNFLTYSKGSAAETSSQLYRAYDRKYITETDFENLKNDVEEISRILNGLIAYLNKSDIRGSVN